MRFSDWLMAQQRRDGVGEMAAFAREEWAAGRLRRNFGPTSLFNRLYATDRALELWFATFAAVENEWRQQRRKKSPATDG